MTAEHKIMTKNDNFQVYTYHSFWTENRDSRRDPKN